MKYLYDSDRQNLSCELEQNSFDKRQSESVMRSVTQLFQDDDEGLDLQSSKWKHLKNLLPKMNFVDLFFLMSGFLALLVYVAVDHIVATTTYMTKKDYLFRLSVLLCCSTLVMVGIVRAMVIVLRKIVDTITHIIDPQSLLPSTIVLYSIDPAIYSVFHSSASLILYQQLILTGLFRDVEYRITWDITEEKSPRVILFILQSLVLFTIFVSSHFYFKTTSVVFRRSNNTVFFNRFFSCQIGDNEQCY